MNTGELGIRAIICKYTINILIMYDILNMNCLLPQEKTELSNLLYGYFTARDRKRWITADDYRHKIALWDKSLGLINGLSDWHPFFETTKNRLTRMINRTENYGVVFYPFNRGKLGIKLSKEESIAAIASELEGYTND